VGERDDGGAATWLRFYLEHRRALNTYAIALTGNGADAHDLLQDVLLRLLRSAAAPENPRAYVMRCLRSAAADRRKSRRAPSPLDDLTVIDAAFLDDAVDGIELRERVVRVQAALRALPPVQREAIVLRIYGELTFQEVAELLDRPPGSVASAYARGMAQLREALGSEVENVHR
jgi:RNA polymerase sigma-70 factor (ECF subfamily)